MKKPAQYYSGVNLALLEQISSGPTHVLDVGCAKGDNGARLKQMYGCRVTGIERDPVPAAVAATKFDQVFQGDAEEMVRQLPLGEYDCVLLGDILEHLTDPKLFLSELRDALQKDARVYVCIPNFIHWTVIQQLLMGRLDYASSGILDYTHRHHFTEDSFISLCKVAGYKAKPLQHITLGSCWEEAAQSALGSSASAKMIAYQLLFELSLISQEEALTSIIIPYHNLAEITIDCLASIERHTPQPYQIILVDNGSEPSETERILAFIEEEGIDYHLIHSGVNLSYAKACNLGLDLAEGLYILVLNNDTIVTPGWLGLLLRRLLDETVGFTGPMSNYIAGAQKVPVAPSKEVDREDYARAFTVRRLGSSLETQAIVGFCMAGRSEVWERTNGFDLRYHNGFEETDLCLRASTSYGYRHVIAGDVFIHHIGSQTFRITGSEQDYWDNISSNYEIFRQTWSDYLPPRLKAFPASAWFFQPKRGPSVYWAMLFDKSSLWQTTDIAMDLAAAGAILHYQRIAIPQVRVDTARNQVTYKFLEEASSPDDCLIMLDTDHYHPPEVLQRLAERGEDVVGALAFRRGPPFNPLFFSRRENGQLLTPAEWIPGEPYLCDAIGFGAIAIKRRVFDAFEEAGVHWPYFRFEYHDEVPNAGGEDMRFNRTCEELGISIVCLTDVEIPHMVTSLVDSGYWSRYKDSHPEIILRKQEV